MVQKEVNCLFTKNTLPFQINALPSTFSQFRKKVENIAIDINLNHLDSLPPMPSEIDVSSLKMATLPLNQTKKTLLFKGGEQAALKHCQTYFETTYPSRYKETRNALDGFDNSTKFSPWLALGCISPTMIYAMLKQYEKINGANESTYWIYFELLWREYFYWYARRYQNALFHFGGIRNNPPLTSFYAQRFQQWKHGQTPFPIVNACMHQLNQTGYMSNRGRQLVASCLVHELNLDWRYGAAYFETQLIDYDVASNWGNWQYLAGVGADPRGSRRFNLDKQTQVYDPDLKFISQWHGECKNSQIDFQDYVDWPITSVTNKGDT
ncbi:DASH family cryptochrome [Shewanella aestuarii]|uniref:DASH family cryptochrome n=1 Tax=Shewanella aestuarii TaxID=1028752 RepID=UPI001FCC0011|nr:DASH family cryptochrome [Shewanella aestuarii]